MKKIVLIVLIFAFNLNLNSQEKATVEKSIFGIQTGVLGIWIHNESRLSDNIALRSEIGLDSGIFGGDFYNNTNFILYPSVTIEPRLYYNLNNRMNRNRIIKKNSGNFLALKFNYIPDLFVISSLENASIAENLSIIPKWAIKRTIGNHFTYETGIGIGFRQYFLKQYGFQNNDIEAALDFHLRIGYTF